MEGAIDLLQKMFSPSPMDQLTDFPFIIGQRVEGRSNIKGYRGAWFRCEIKDIQLRRDGIWCALQYLDFPDEKVSFTKAYQQGVAEKRRKVLMLRPSFPPVFCKADEAAARKVTGVVAIRTDEWKAGNYVDWWFDGCYWMAKITAVHSRDFVQVELPISPLGEGGEYKASVKDLRPSLNWSVRQQWTVPCDEVGPDHEPFVFLLGLPSRQDSGALQVADCIQKTNPESVFCTNEKREIAAMSHMDPDAPNLVLKGTAIEGTNSGSVADFSTDWKHRRCQTAKQCSWLNCALPESSTPCTSEVNFVVKDGLSNCSGQLREHDVEARNMPRKLEKWIKRNDEKPNLKRKSCLENGNISEAGEVHFQSACDKWFEAGTKLAAWSRNDFSAGSMNKVVGNGNNQFAKDGTDMLVPMEKDSVDLAEKFGNGNTHSLNRCLEEAYIPWKHQTDTNACMFEGEKLKSETTIHCTGMHELQDMNHRDDGCNMVISKRNCPSAYTVAWGSSCDIHEQSDVALFEQTIHSLSQEGKCVNLEEGSIGSQAVALEELVSRVIWLKGVLQFGLKGWSHERSKKKWILCETECTDVVLQHKNASQQENRGSEGEENSEKAMQHVIDELQL
eukprot:c26322_g1_i2 orf=196-2043(+)